MTENETSIKIYDLASKITFNLMLKIISSNSIVAIDFDIDTEIKNLNIEIREISAGQLLEYKGIDYKILKDGVKCRKLKNIEWQKINPM